MALYSATIEVAHNSGGRTVNASVTNAAKGRVDIEEEITDGATDLVIVHPSIDVSKVKQCFIKSSQQVAIKNTNVGADDEITLKANVPYWWHEDDYNTLKFTEDIGVGELTVSNSSGATAIIHFRWIVDTTT